MRFSGPHDKGDAGVLRNVEPRLDLDRFQDARRHGTRRVLEMLSRRTVHRIVLEAGQCSRPVKRLHILLHLPDHLAVRLKPDGHRALLSPLRGDGHREAARARLYDHCCHVTCTVLQLKGIDCCHELSRIDTKKNSMYIFRSPFREHSCTFVANTYAFFCLAWQLFVHALISSMLPCFASSSFTLGN